MPAASGSSNARSGPPIKSALFSLSANAAASLSDALSDKVKTEMPWADDECAESACNEIKRSA